MENKTINTNNIDELKSLCSNLDDIIKTTKLGGGKLKIEQQHKNGKLTARERIELLFDKNSESIEIGSLVANNMYSEYGGCPSAGVIIKIGYIHQQLFIVVANDSTVKAGAWFPLTAKKNLRAQEISIENNLPIIYLVDSAGVFLPLQDEVFPDKEHFGRIFRNNAIMSSKGIFQISAIMGSCVAGGAYLPIMSDEALIVENTGSIFLAGSYLVKAAIGENIDNETLGGANTHCSISGITDYKCENDIDCIEKIRYIVGNTKFDNKNIFKRDTPKMPKINVEKLYSIFPYNRLKQYDIRDVIECIVDDSEYLEYKADYGQTIVCAYAKIDGWAVGIVANQRKIVKSKKEGMQMGGVIYSDSADKSARFIMNCNQKKIPLIFLKDVTGFMVGSKSEHNGIIKDGAKLVNAMSNSIVPKITIVIGNSYGAGDYAMCGKAYDPLFNLAWPTAKIAVMGGEQAAKVLMQIEKASLEKNGESLDEEKEKELFNKIKEKYEFQTNPYYASARLWVDEIIKPEETRKFISFGIQVANNRKKLKKYNVGIIQT